MELLTITIAAGETKRFERAGRYIEVIDAVGRLSLFLLGKDGQRADQAQNALSGIFLESDYSAIEIYSVIAQTITLLITDGRGGSRRQPGNVSIVDRISDVCRSDFVSDVTLGFSAVAIVAPAANVRGLVVRGSICQSTAGSGGTCNTRLMASKTTPTDTIGNAGSLVMNSSNSVSSADIGRNQEFNVRIELLPGWGLFLVKNTTVIAAQTSNISLSYELMP